MITRLMEKPDRAFAVLKVFVVRPTKKKPGRRVFSTPPRRLEIRERLTLKRLVDAFLGNGGGKRELGLLLLVTMPLPGENAAAIETEQAKSASFIPSVFE